MEEQTQKLGAYDVRHALIVIKGISKKTGKPYTMLAVRRNSTFDQFIINQAIEQGIEVLDFTKNVDTNEDE